MVNARGNIWECDQSFILTDIWHSLTWLAVMPHDRPTSDQYVPWIMNTIGQLIDINNIMPWLDVCFYFIKKSTKIKTITFHRPEMRNDKWRKSLVLFFVLFRDKKREKKRKKWSGQEPMSGWLEVDSRLTWARAWLVQLRSVALILFLWKSRNFYFFASFMTLFNDVWGNNVFAWLEPTEDNGEKTDNIQIYESLLENT